MAKSSGGDLRFYSMAEMEKHGVMLDANALHVVAGEASSDIRSGHAYGLKSVLLPLESELWERPELNPYRKEFDGERLGWKLSTLSSVGPDYAAVKIVGANALNRHLGRTRSTSTIALFDKVTLAPICLLDGTEISAARTATYATTVVGRFLSGREGLSVFIFGAGPVAERVILGLGIFPPPPTFSNVYLRSRSVGSAVQLAAKLEPRVAFPLITVDDNAELSGCDLVITASNAKTPVFDDVEASAGAITLHLGGDETPGPYIHRVLRTGRLLCDDVAMVSRRNSQSLALYFSRGQVTLEMLAPVLGNTNFCDLAHDVQKLYHLD
ncbi:ornithine cyclodeaminase [Pararhizobium sp. DWP3-4]|uniref:ornithine cyclodeaminase n=1 Tax=Pararhizobium sp. DWP3-4 TaxID=2804565 RepID=UPI003CEB09A0